MNIDINDFNVGGVEARAHFSPHRDAVEFWIDAKFQGKRLVVNKIEGEPERNAACERPVAFRLRMDAAQILMDDLWRAGLRPTEGKGSAGALAATERHLLDAIKSREQMYTLNRLLLTQSVTLEEIK